MRLWRLTVFLLFVAACTSTVRNSNVSPTSPSNAQAVAVCDSRPIEQRAHCMKMLEVALLQARISSGEKDLEKELKRAKAELATLEQQLLLAAGATGQVATDFETSNEEEPVPTAPPPVQRANAAVVPEPVVFLPRIVKITPTTGISIGEISETVNSRVRMYGLKRAVASVLPGKPENVLAVVLINGKATCSLQGGLEPILIDAKFHDGIPEPAIFDGPCPAAGNRTVSDFYFAVSSIDTDDVFINTGPSSVTVWYLIWNGEIDRNYVPEEKVWTLIATGHDKVMLNGKSKLPFPTH